jgi:hypothetical protein
MVTAWKESKRKRAFWLIKEREIRYVDSSTVVGYGQVDE